MFFLSRLLREQLLISPLLNDCLLEESLQIRWGYKPIHCHMYFLYIRWHYDCAALVLWYQDSVSVLHFTLSVLFLKCCWRDVSGFVLVFGSLFDYTLHSGNPCISCQQHIIFGKTKRDDCSSEKSRNKTLQNRHYWHSVSGSLKEIGSRL